MIKQLANFSLGVVVGSVFATVALVSTGVATGASDFGQAAAKAQSTTKVILENDRVRVRDVTFPPGETPMHKHELPHVGVVIQGGTLVFKYPDGKSETARLELGGAGYREANVTHQPVNTGTSPVRVIEVELK